MITMIVELSCDAPDCEVAYAPDITEMTSLKATRVGSVIAGWVQVGRQDFCPDHAQDSRIETIRGLAAKRLTDDEIADRLGVSRNTVYKLRKANDIAPGIGRTGRPSGSGARR